MATTGEISWQRTPTVREAVSEAEDEFRHGRNAFALDVAHTARTAQAREIAQMSDLLAALH